MFVDTKVQYRNIFSYYQFLGLVNIYRALKKEKKYLLGFIVRNWSDLNKSRFIIFAKGTKNWPVTSEKKKQICEILKR